MAREKVFPVPLLSLWEEVLENEGKPNAATIIGLACTP
jgi:hypothetical protein